MLVLYCSQNFNPRSSCTKRCVPSNGYNFRILPFLPFNYHAEMYSVFINAPSSSSSMNQTYPPSCNKPSKQELKHSNCNPTRNKQTHPFVLRSSSHSLCMGHRCRQTLHSLVLFCLPFHTPLSIGVWLWLYCFLLVCGHTLYGFVFGYLCVVFVFFMTLVYM